MNWQSAVERTVAGLGYDLVDAEKSAGGLLRVFIDHPPPEPAANGALPAERFINVDDCEKVTRQLQHVLEVDNVAYERLEVSSPGLDRPLKKAADYARFAGEQIDLTLKLPFQGRKKYRGELQAAGDGWRLLLADDSGARPGKSPKAGKGAKPVAAKTRAVVRAEAAEARNAAAGAGVQAAPLGGGLALDFSLDEVRDARLVPAVDFKGRRPEAAAPVAGLAAPETAAAPAPTPRASDEVDGGRIQ